MTGGPFLWTIGHSAHPAERLVELLRAARIERVIDVRSTPYSRRHPQFGREALAATLARAGIAYAHAAALGGLRPPRPDSRHRGLLEAGFRGYADHMETPAFLGALDELISGARAALNCILCAEANPDHCHRRILADALTARGVRVVHIHPDGVQSTHAPHPAAVFDDARVLYPGPPNLFEV